MNDWYTVFQVNGGEILLVATFRYQGDAEGYLQGLHAGYMSLQGRILERKNVDI